jgi:hypothetical protein
MIEREPNDGLARYGIPTRVAEFSALQTPDWILWLMQQLAPEFAHASELSVKKGLLFLQPIDEQLAWAVAIDKESRGNMFRFGPSPTLSLEWLKDPTRRRPPVVMYRDVLANDNRLGATWPREIEMQLTKPAALPPSDRVLPALRGQRGADHVIAARGICAAHRRCCTEAALGEVSDTAACSGRAGWRRRCNLSLAAGRRARNEHSDASGGRGGDE